MRVSGDGFVTLADGSLRWGRFGAAGVLVRCPDEALPWYFLARRSEWCHQGGCWAIPGGALTGWVRHDRLVELELHHAFQRTLERLGFLPAAGA